jgi:hypothetical protein
MSQNIPELERITFFNGQQLTAADLSELQRTNRELRWLHNRSLHRWGIGFGLDATGQKGDSTVTITPGYGVDCMGREIILTQPVTKTVPAVGSGTGGAAANFYLVAAYQADADQKVLARKPGICSGEGAVRLGEEPLIDWRKPEQLLPGNELILAQASILNCQLSQPLSLAVRRYARPAHQPYIAVGQTVAVETQWQPWKDNGNQFGIYTIVDTSAAHFKTTPRYVAHIMGERFLMPAPGPLLVVGVPSVGWVSPTAFMLQVLLPAFPATVPPVNPPPVFNVGVTGKPDVVQLLKWQVVWMGIEG